jgi:hypothetical protein
MIRNTTPMPRYTFNGERRPISFEGGEWLSVSERKFSGLVRALIIVVGSGLGWGVAIGLVVMAMELVR